MSHRPERGGFRAALDFAWPMIEETGMKHLLLLLMLSLSLVRLNAAVFALDGVDRKSVV